MVSCAKLLKKQRLESTRGVNLVKIVLLAFLFLFHFSLMANDRVIAKSDSVFDDSDLADIEGLDERDEDSELEDEFEDSSTDSIEDNFDVEDFEMVEESEPEDEINSSDKTDETLEEEFDKEDYEVLSDKPGYEIITDEELEQEFSEETTDQQEESADSEEDEEEMEEDEEEMEEDEEEMEEDEEEMEEDEEGMSSEQADIEKEMEEQKEELERLDEELDSEEELVEEELGAQEQEAQEEFDSEEESLGLEQPPAFKDPVVEGLPVEEEETTATDLNLITNIRYLAEKDQIVIDSSEIVSYQERNNSETNQLIIEILQAKLDENLHWPYVLRDFNTDFGLIKADQKDSSTVRVIVQLKEGAGFPKTTLSQDGYQIIVGYGEIVNNEIVSEDMAKAKRGSDPSSILPAKTLEDLYFGNIEFSGTPVSFHVIDAPIKQVLRFISEESGLNMVIDESVSGTVTLKLEDVPWDQALHTIFKVKSLGYTRDGNVITILPLSKIEERSRKLKEISDRQKSLSPFKTKVIPIMYAKAVDIENKVKEFSTQAAAGFKGGRIIVHEESNTLVVVDTEETVKKITAMAQFLDKPPQQVLIETKIVEVAKSFARNFGFRWSIGGDLPVRINANGFLDFFRSAFDNLGGSYSTSYNEGNAEGGFAVNGLPFIGDVNATLSLAESDNSAQVLSTAKIVVKSGQSASITKNTPITIAAARTTAQGANTAGANTGAGNTAGVAPGSVVAQETFQPQDVTFSVQVTPIVTSSGNIAIQANINLGDPGGPGGAYKTDRTASTEVLTKSGKTVVVSGIYQKKEDQTNQKMPWVGEIPILGWLFKNKSLNSSESEMLMFITPTLVEQ